MLVLTRKPNEEIFIGDDIKVVIVDVRGERVRVGIEAPQHVKIRRAELPPDAVEELRRPKESA